MTSTQTFFIWGLLLYLIGSLPNLDFRRDRGYASSGIVAVLVILLVLWLVLGHSRSVGQVGHDAGSDLRSLGEDVKQDVHQAAHDVQGAVR